MLEPVAVQDLMAAAMTGAGVILFGAFYALFFALARLQERRSFLLLALAAYAGLVFCVVVLARTLNLDGFWQSLIVVMLVGYLAAPYGIWHLCVGTHKTKKMGNEAEQA